ncbi:thioredoxin family protein [Chloroflexota bacterium]
MTILKTRLFIIALVLSLCLPLALGCQQTAPPADSDGKSPTFDLTVDLLGKTHAVLLDSEGKIESRAELSSDDGTVALSIDAGTTLLDKSNKLLSKMQLEIDTDPLPLPANAAVIGPVYNLKPQDATHNPPIRLTLSYDPRELPEVVRESDVYIAPYDEASGWGKWSYKNVDTKSDRVTTQISSFGRFAVLAPMPPAPSQAAPIVPAQPSRIVSLREALSNGKPTLAEFGASTCIPCKQMKPILEDLAVEYQGKLNVVIVEVYEQMELTQRYGIMTIPTQIVFDSSGKEVKRHIGLWSREEIIAQLKKMEIE